MGGNDLDVVMNGGDLASGKERHCVALLDGYQVCCMCDVYVITIE
jgi:hypothetical protein